VWRGRKCPFWYRGVLEINQYNRGVKKIPILVLRVKTDFGTGGLEKSIGGSFKNGTGRYN